MRGAPAHQGVIKLEPGEAIALCQAAHRRLLSSLDGLEDATARRPSLLPGWSVGHVLTHVARNADGHVRRLEGTLAGSEVARYPGGQAQREAEIEQGASRAAVELLADVRESALRLEETWERCQRASWPHRELLAADRWAISESPSRRLREVEVHHVDLGLGYQVLDWPEEYVQWELHASLERLPERLSDRGDARRFLAWLIGRAGWPEGLRLPPWL